MEMNNGSARRGRSQAIRDDLLDGQRNARLPVAAPRAIQRCLNPDFAHEYPLVPFPELSDGLSRT